MTSAEPHHIKINCEPPARRGGLHLLGGHRARCSCGWWSDCYAQASDTERAIEVHLRDVKRRIDSAIDDLYWTFTRTKRGKPPVLVRPDLYDRRRELAAAIEKIAAARRIRVPRYPVSARPRRKVSRRARSAS